MSSLIATNISSLQYCHYIQLDLVAALIMTLSADCTSVTGLTVSRICVLPSLTDFKISYDWDRNTAPTLTFRFLETIYTDDTMLKAWVLFLI